MAIAEARVGVIRKVDLMPQPAKAKLELTPVDYPREEIEKLALLYFNNRRFIEGLDQSRMDPSQAMILGYAEIQALVLRMLGQEHLLDDKRPTYEDVVKPRLIGERQIKNLSDRYRVCKKEEQLMESVGKATKITPVQARIQANAAELGRMLNEFGQEDLVRSIDKELDPDYNRINWDKMRSTGNGELQ